ncbi:MAG: ABC transporter ATP-binding protein [Gammaproteobacteria bacterium]|nr:ABC transporter ATP-binding protein [Gammaproteobacteria bacterium]
MITVEVQSGAAPIKASNLQIIRRLLKYMSPFNRIMFISLIARVIKFAGQACVLGLAAWGVGAYIEVYLAGPQDGAILWNIIWQWVGYIAIAGTVVGITSYLENYTGHYVAFRILAAFRDKFYYAMLPLAPARTAKLQSGDAVSRVMTDCERVEPFYAHTIAPAIAAIFVPLIILGWCWTVHPQIVYFLTPFYIANTVLLPWLVSKLGGDGVEYRNKLGEVNGFVSDSIQGVRDTVAFGYEDRRAEQLFTIGATMQAGQEKLYGADAWQRALAEVFITVGILASAWVGADLAIAGEIAPLTELPAVIAVSVVGFYLSVGLANNYTDYRVALIAARRLFSMMDQAPAVEDVATTPVVGDIESAITIRDLVFEYDADDSEWSRERRIFDGLDLDIQPGKNIALVGPSGTGKSTVINLLLRQWDPQGGSIQIGGHELTQFPLADLQRYFAVVSQRSFIFNDTIRQNIRMGKYDASDDEIMAAANEAGLSAFIADSHEGLDTECGERGSKLSGGQRQRVAIARAVLKDAPVVLLDEATSSLDVETERGVMEALKKLSEGRTTLTIAHRLSTIVDSDEILVMLEGKIAEKGSHGDLMELNGWYAKMFRMQQDEVDTL